MWQITAAKRPKNSALEVNLDFDHKARPPPVITDEITASLEDLIRRRIIEVIHFAPSVRVHLLYTLDILIICLKTLLYLQYDYLN